MKKSVVFLFVLIGALAAAFFLAKAAGLFKPNAGNNAYHKIDAAQAKQMQEESGVTVVDVRTQQEYETGHVPGAVLLPVDSIGASPPQTLPDKTATLLLYCRTGVRSKRAAEKLVRLGYENVYDFGGISDWPYETETGAYKE